ncbi:MAG: metal-dependent transcriptional regulator [Clostridia bacterium]|nr:metal-dependent transcriptional regulator [Clostridia bacterium]
MEQLTIAMEHYLETVYDLSAGADGCRVSDIAARLEVSKASVNNAMNVLAARGLVENEKYREIKLTVEGQRLAELLSHKHAILQRLLSQVMGVPEEQAYEDACSIEHIISSTSVSHIQAFLKGQGIDIS